MTVTGLPRELFPNRSALPPENLAKRAMSSMYLMRDFLIDRTPGDLEAFETTSWIDCFGAMMLAVPFEGSCLEEVIPKKKSRGS